MDGHFIKEFKETFIKVFPELTGIDDPIKMGSFIEENKPLGKDRPYFYLLGLMPLGQIYELAMGEPVNGFHPMQCLDCAAEHVAKAMVNLDEILKGYDGKIFKEQPDHIPLLLGNIAEAEAQTVRIHSDIAQKVRALKLRIRELDMTELRNAKAELNTLFWAIIDRKRGASPKEEISPLPDKPCNCGKKK
jgi:hypothetical protein